MTGLGVVVWLGASLFSGDPCPVDLSLFVEVNGTVHAQPMIPGSCAAVPKGAKVRAICVGPSEDGRKIEARGEWTEAVSMKEFPLSKSVPCRVRR